MARYQTRNERDDQRRIEEDVKRRLQGEEHFVEPIPNRVGAQGRQRNLQYGGESRRDPNRDAQQGSGPVQQGQQAGRQGDESRGWETQHGGEDREFRTRGRQTSARAQGGSDQRRSGHGQRGGSQNRGQRSERRETEGRRQGERRGGGARQPDFGMTEAERRRAPDIGAHESGPGQGATEGDRRGNRSGGERSNEDARRRRYGSRYS